MSDEFQSLPTPDSASDTEDLPVPRSVIAVVVAGGQGARFLPWSRVLPKILTPLGDGALLDQIVDQLLAAGVPTMHLLLGQHAATVAAYVAAQRYEDRGLEVVVHHDTAEMGTAGPLRVVDSNADHWLVINGDVYAELPLRDVLAECGEDDPDMVVLTARYTEQLPYGVVHVDERRNVVAVVEKPVTELEVNAGIYVLGPAARKQLSWIGADTMPDLIGRCLSVGLTVRARALEGAWHDIGTPETWYRANVGLRSSQQ